MHSRRFSGTITKYTKFKILMEIFENIHRNFTKLWGVLTNLVNFFQKLSKKTRTKLWNPYYLVWFVNCTKRGVPAHAARNSWTLKCPTNPQTNWPSDQLAPWPNGSRTNPPMNPTVSFCLIRRPHRKTLLHGLCSWVISQTRPVCTKSIKYVLSITLINSSSANS